MMRHTIVVAVLAASLGGCSKADKTGAGAVASAAAIGTSAAQPRLLISPEDLLEIRSNSLASGPSITGSVQPERRADLRAEVSTVVLQVLKENGDPVKRGELLVRLDDNAIRDSLTSADASVRAATQTYDQAQRQFQRLAKLRESGVVSAQAVEDAEISRNNSQSALEAARTRAVLARQESQRTEVRAPFDGIVSDRKVSVGDTAQVGKELIKVIDPSSMRFEGLVSADHVGKVQAGQRVVFRVHGYEEKDFVGMVTRVNPAANTTTRQVEVLVEFEDPGQQPKVGGLYGEGRIETHSGASLTIPASALVRSAEQAFAWRVHGDVLQKVSLNLGERDARTGEFALQSGLAPGDKVLRHPGSALRDGQKIETAPTAATSSTGK